jgi:hypothetical protein
MNHRPKILMVHSDDIYSLAHFVLVEKMSWDESLSTQDLSFWELVEDYRCSHLVMGYTPVITRLCREMRSSAFVDREVDECMVSLLDQFRLVKSLIEGLEAIGTM